MNQRPFLAVLFAFAAMVFTVSTLPADEPKPSVPVSIAIIGDSTVSDYAPTNVLRGWGQLLPEFFAPGTKILNFARSGASTRTFLKLPNWNKALESKADFLLIQFGHNDSHGEGHPEATAAGGEYAENLRKMVAAARAAGSTPILITPMHRRSFDAAGKVTNELQPYAEAMKKVAAETKTPLVDLQQMSGEVFEKLGDAGSEALTGPKDRTHFTDKGARLMASLVAKGLADCDGKLKAARVEAPKSE